MLKLKIKLCQTQTEKEEKNLWKSIIIKEKKFLSHLIKCVEELEKVCLNKQIFKHHKSFLNS